MHPPGSTLTLGQTVQTYATGAGCLVLSRLRWGSGGFIIIREFIIREFSFGNESVSECVHMVHVHGSGVDLFQEVLQLLDENALLEPEVRNKRL